MRIMMTGAAGFVGPHIAQALWSLAGKGVQIAATSKIGGDHPVLGVVEGLDVTDEGAVRSAIVRHQPTHVIHLAAIAAVGAAATDPGSGWALHVQGTLNVAHAVLDHAPECWLLNVGSGLVYGDSARAGRPLDERALLAPLDEYAVTKAAADLALGALAHRGLKVVRLRPFNHTGRGQSELFVLPAFAMQIAQIEAGLVEPVLHVGNLDAERDFLDVRDVASAYVLTALRTKELAHGLILNIASGTASRIGDLLQRLLALSRMGIAVKPNPARVRAADLARVVGDAKLAQDTLGWTPQYSLDDMLGSILEDCRARVAQAVKSRGIA